MGQRNMLYTGPMLETEHGHLHPEPSVVPYGGISSFPPPTSSHTILPPLGNHTCFNPQHMAENHGHFHHGVDHHRPANVTDYTNVFMTPTPSAHIFPVHGIQDSLPFSTVRGSFERNEGQFVDALNGVFKRKNAEGFIGNVQYFYPSPGSSSSTSIPMNTEGAMMDAVGHRRSRNRGPGAIAVDPVLAHSSSHLIAGNYGGQPLQAVPTPWLDQPFCGNSSDAGAFSWNYVPGIPYLQAPINGGGMEATNVGLHGYQVAAGTRNLSAFVHPLLITPHQGSHNLHQPLPPPMPPIQGHNMDFQPQLASTSRRLPTNNPTTSFPNGMEPRFVGPTPPTGLRIYRPHRQLMVDAAARHRGFPHLRVLPEDGVAILDISGYHEVGHSVDHHRDMRLDIDHMSYEELLALGEQIGSVGSGLSDDFILQNLKTRAFGSSKSSSNLEESANDQELNSCVICQTNYDDQEHIGVLDCGHEYHVECIKKWLIVKNTCPVCKSTALAAQAKES